MKDIKLDKKKAKQVGGFAGKHAGDHVQSGDYIIMVRHGHVVRVTEKNLADWKQWGSNEYYVTVPAGQEDMVRDLYAKQQEIERIEVDLKKKNDKKDELAGKLQDIITGITTSRVVVAWNRCQGLTLEKARKYIRPQDTLVAFWCHLEREQLYYAVVDISGFLDSETIRAYDVGYKNDQFHPTYVKYISDYGDLSKYIEEGKV